MDCVSFSTSPRYSRFVHHIQFAPTLSFNKYTYILVASHSMLDVRKENKMFNSIKKWTPVIQADNLVQLNGRQGKVHFKCKFRIRVSQGCSRHTLTAKCQSTFATPKTLSESFDKCIIGYNLFATCTSFSLNILMHFKLSYVCVQSRSSYAFDMIID